MEFVPRLRPRLKSGPMPLLMIVFLCTGCGSEPRVQSYAEVPLQAPDTVELGGSSGAVRWALTGNPVRIGADLSDPNPVNSFADILDVGLMSEGRIVVGEYTQCEVRLFLADGRPDTASVRKGGGPGEVNRCFGLGLMEGDTIVLWGAGPYEILTLSPTGEVVSEQWAIALTPVTTTSCGHGDFGL